MKRYVRATDNNDIMLDLSKLQILSIVLVDDASKYDPRADYVYDVYSSRQIDYSLSSTREQLLELDPKIRKNIHDIAILRKLKYDELTVQQQREVTQANKVEEKRLTHAQMQPFLDRLQDCVNVFVIPTEKNLNFRNLIFNMGGRIRDEDVLDIIQSLTYSNYKYSKYSYSDKNWNTLLSVFRYQGSYTFPPMPKNGQPVTVDSLDMYIKLDLNEETSKGYVAISFHNWNDQ